MIIGVFDITSGVIAITMAVALVSITMPYGNQWRPLRRMNRLLFASYACMGISNLLTGLVGVADQEDSVMWIAVLPVSMFHLQLRASPLYLLTDPNGNSIFLPAAGCRDGKNPYNEGTYGYYWSSTANPDISKYAKGILFFLRKRLLYIK